MLETSEPWNLSTVVKKDPVKEKDELLRLVFIHYVKGWGGPQENL